MFICEDRCAALDRTISTTLERPAEDMDLVSLRAACTSGRPYTASPSSALSAISSAPWVTGSPQSHVPSYLPPAPYYPGLAARQSNLFSTCSPIPVLKAATACGLVQSREVPGLVVTCKASRSTT